MPPYGSTRVNIAPNSSGIIARMGHRPYILRAIFVQKVAGFASQNLWSGSWSRDSGVLLLRGLFGVFSGPLECMREVNPMAPRKQSYTEDGDTE